MNNYCRILMLLSVSLFCSCVQNTKKEGKTDNADSLSIVTDTLAVDSVKNNLSANKDLPMTPDELINKAAKFYAGISREGVELSGEGVDDWEAYSKGMKKQTSVSFNTLSKVDKLVEEDMFDLRAKCDYVFYPFSGPDFFYPITIFPEADNYFLVGLESAGTINTNINAGDKYYDLYKKSLKIFMGSSFFRTNSMKNDFSNEEIDGTVPVISMLMTLKDCEILSIHFKVFNEDGTLADSKVPGKLAEIRFVKKSTPNHVQTLYYLSTNLHDSSFSKYFEKYIAVTLPQYNVVTYLKAASYLMYESYFSKIRTAILDYSFAVLQDDSGIPYRYFVENFDNTLYGTYVHPLSIFKERDYQLDLLEKYETDSVRALPFRIGYNNPSNWMCARKKVK